MPEAFQDKCLGDRLNPMLQDVVGTGLCSAFLDGNRQLPSRTDQPLQ